MNLDDLIDQAASNVALAASEVELVARRLGLPVAGLIDLFARTVAVRYLRGEYAFGFADMAVNQLFGFAHAESGLGLSEFAWRVYGAFDEGEYIREGEPVDEQGEVRTRQLLARNDSLHGA
jgi:hypothetical protein